MSPAAFDHGHYVKVLQDTLQPAPPRCVFYLLWARCSQLPQHLCHETPVCNLVQWGLERSNPHSLQMDSTA